MTRIFCIILCLLAYCSIDAQIDEKQVWASTAIKYKISKKDRVSFEYENRSDFPGLAKDRHFMQFGYRRIQWDKIEFLTDVRYAIKPEDVVSEWRLGIGVQFKQDISKFSLGLRSMWQSEVVSEDKEAYVWSENTSEIRNRFRIDYKWNKMFETSISTEFFYDLTEARPDRWRNALLQSVDLTKNHSVQVGIGYQRRNLHNAEKLKGQLLYIASYGFSF